MTPKKIFVLVSVLVTTVLTSCNLYSPLEGGGSVQDHIEIAQECLTRGDYDCASTEYNALPDGTLKQQKLCAVYLSQAGFTLSTLVTVFKSAQEGAREKTLGTVANRILPYTASRQSGADKAIVACKAYRDLNPTGDELQLAELLQSLSYFTHCAVLMAKTTSLQTVDDVACTTASTSTTVTAASISKSGTGTVDAANPGMCSADALACVDDISKMAPASVSQDDFKKAFTDLQTKVTGGAAPVARAGLISTL